MLVKWGGKCKCKTNSLGCTLRYLKYICSPSLMCLIHLIEVDYEYGYYLTQWMSTTVRAEIYRGWDQVIH